MNKLFIYGTLVDSKIQKEVLNKTFKLTAQTLLGYKIIETKIDGVVYPAVVQDLNGKVEGFTIEVSNEDLQKIDLYETDKYKRIIVSLINGEASWVYIKNENL